MTIKLSKWIIIPRMSKIVYVKRKFKFDLCCCLVPVNQTLRQTPCQSNDSLDYDYMCVHIYVIFWKSQNRVAITWYLRMIRQNVRSSITPFRHKGKYDGIEHNVIPFQNTRRDPNPEDQLMKSLWRWVGKKSGSDLSFSQSIFFWSLICLSFWYCYLKMVFSASIFLKFGIFVIIIFTDAVIWYEQCWYHV